MVAEEIAVTDKAETNKEATKTTESAEKQTENSANSQGTQ